MQKGDIYIAQLSPSIGSEINKIRPVLVFQNDIACQKGNTVTVLPISSKLFKNRIFEVQLKKNRENKLLQDSKILVYQIRTIDKQRLSKKIGSVSKAVLHEAELKLTLHLGLDQAY